MALTKTSLAAACADQDLKLRVTSSVGATAGCLVLIGGEYMFCTSVDNPNQISVRGRGSLGGLAKAHAILAPVTYGLASDFPGPSFGQPAVTMVDWDVKEVGVDQGYDPGVAGQNTLGNTEVVITKATPIAQTVTAPSQAADGVEVRYLSSNAQAHVITFNPTIGGKTTATFAAGGASVTLRAQNGAWTIIASGGVTLA